jgi:branched-subunit amino acid ABC-type transport system permease component
MPYIKIIAISIVGGLLIGLSANLATEQADTTTFIRLAVIWSLIFTVLGVIREVARGDKGSHED